MLARVQVHCGWATNTSVGRSFARTNVLWDGHRAGAFASAPGRFSYAHTADNPAVTPVSHTSASTHSSQALRFRRAGLSDKRRSSGGNANTDSNRCARDSNPASRWRYFRIEGDLTSPSPLEDSGSRSAFVQS